MLTHVKVETIGDAYMIVSGNDDAPNHAARLLCLATEMLEVSRCIRLPRASVRTLAACSHLALPTLESRPLADLEDEWGGGVGHIRLRIGVHTGPAFAGVIGTKMPRFSFFGGAPLWLRASNSPRCTARLTAASLAPATDHACSAPLPQTRSTQPAAWRARGTPCPSS